MPVREGKREMVLSRVSKGMRVTLLFSPPAAHAILARVHGNGMAWEDSFLVEFGQRIECTKKGVGPAVKGQPSSCSTGRDAIAPNPRR